MKHPSKNPKNARHQRNTIPLFLKIYVGTVCALSLLVILLIVHLDGKASQTGYGGLWEYFTGPPIVNSAEKVNDRIEFVLASIGVFSTNIISDEIRLDTQGKERSHRVYLIDKTDIWTSVQNNLSRNLKNSGIAVHNRMTSSHPEYSTVFYRVGITESITHELEFRHYDDGSEESNLFGEPEKYEGLRNDRQPEIAVVFDDFGNDQRMANRFLSELDYPIALAVIPFLKHSTEISKQVKQSGQTLLIHMPMEPSGSDTVAKGTEGLLRVELSAREIGRLVEAAMESVPDADGMNNHMGSKFTADPIKMKELFLELKKLEISFLDSRTTSSTTAPMMAAETGIAFASRSVFLDQGYLPERVDPNIERLLQLARKNGSAIGIGHAQNATLNAMKNFHSRAASEGINVVPVTDLMRVSDNNQSHP